MSPSLIEEQAAAWVVAHDRGLTATEQDAFSEWLAADARHGRAYQEQRKAWNEFGLLAEWRPRHSREPNPDILDASLLSRTRRRQRWMQATTVAAGVAFVLWGGLFLFQSAPRPSPTIAAQETPAPRHVSANETRFVTLPDRSEIDLNEGTELVVDFSASRRSIAVLRGEAFFTVAKDASRPFDVTVGGTTVRAVGTQFGVKLEGERVSVVVAEGQVLFGTAEAVAHAAAGKDAAGTVQLRPGDFSAWILNAIDTLPAVRRLPAAETHELLRWKPDVLEFASTPLAEVVEAFNQRNTVKISLVDASLRPLPIVASFRANNIQGFVNLLEVTGVARVARVSDTSIELSAP